ncbi:unnamed protein product, partial [Vitrella brassicaformis CCMP3155]
MTARQAALAAAGAGQKRKPAMDVDVSSDGEEEDGSEWEERGRRTTKAAGKKKQRVDKKDKAAAAAGKAKPKKKGGRSKAQATDEGHQMEDIDDALDPKADLKVFEWVAERLQAQLTRVEEAAKRAHEVWELRQSLPAPETHTQQNRMKEVERQFRVWSSMVCTDAGMQTHISGAIAKKQHKETITKLDTIQHKINEIDQDEAEEIKSHLEELPEVLWMSGGAGLGALVGFVSCMESLSSVNSYFRCLTQQPSMHPIVDLDASPTMNIAKKWIGRRLSECVSINIYHRPTPSLVYLLESLSAKVESVDLQCPYEPPTDKKGKDLPDYRALAAFERDNRNRKGNFSRIRLPHKKGPIVFERLESASIRSVWVKIAEDREYQLPVLKDLGLEDIGCSHEVRLDQVAEFLKDTPSAKSLTSLTGRVSFHQQSQSVYEKVPDDAFIDRIATDIGPLDEIEMGLAEVQKSQYIQKLHRFRSKVLSTDAVETYYHNLPPKPKYRWQRTVKASTDLHLHLPFTGNGEALADCRDTVQVCCRQANKVTLDACRRSDHVKKIPGLDSLVCESATELTIMAGDGKKKLPSYIRSDPTAVFPRVSSVVVSQQGSGEDFYECGAGDVLHALSPSLHKAYFEFSVRAEPEATCTLVPDGLGFMSSEGKEVEVQLKFHIYMVHPIRRYYWHAQHHNTEEQREPSVEWQLYGDSEAGQEFMESGRVSSLNVHIEGELRVQEARKMHSSFVGCVVEAFSSFPALKCVVLRVDKPPLFGPRFDLAGELRKAGKKRLRVTERTDGTVVLRPSQTRR